MNGRQAPSGPLIIFQKRVDFPIITWSGAVNPPFPIGKVGEGQTTKSSNVTVVGVRETDAVLCTLEAGDNIIFTFGLPFSFGYCMIENTPIATPKGEARRVQLGISYLQDLGPLETASMGQPTRALLTFFRVSDNLELFP